jgi:hypothetical protein
VGLLRHDTPRLVRLARRMVKELNSLPADRAGTFAFDYANALIQAAEYVHEWSDAVEIVRCACSALKFDAETADALCPEMEVILAEAEKHPSEASTAAMATATRGLEGRYLHLVKKLVIVGEASSTNAVTDSVEFLAVEEAGSTSAGSDSLPVPVVRALHSTISLGRTITTWAQKLAESGVPGSRPT